MQDKKKVLIVEDNPKNFELLKDLLEVKGYFIIKAITAEEGIESAKSESPDLILMDLSLPGMDGLSATRILKQDSFTKDIPVIALTAHVMKGDVERSLDAGCVSYISKPIDTRSFVKKIKEYV